MAQGARLLLVDDDPEIREIVVRYLEGEGMEVAAVGSAAALRAELRAGGAEIVLLDLVLPDGDGLALMRELKADTAPGVILLTAKGEVIDRVLGLEMGADDYVAKPFHLRELLARIKSLQRRLRGTREEEATPLTNGIAFLGFHLDRGRRELRAPDGRPIELTSGEFELLTAFVQAPGRVLSREQLLELTRGRSWEPYDRAIDVQVGRLRRKIEPDPARPSLIKTVRGAGYVFTARIEAGPGG
jgi:two-component system, OmpR family, response regulator